MSSIDDRRALWRGLLAEQVASGLSASAWCRGRGVAVHTFSYWRKRLRQIDAVPAGWVSVGSGSAHSSSAEGVTLRVGLVSIDVAAGFDPQLLRDVLGVLVARC